MEHTPAVRAALRPVAKDALNNPHFPGHDPRRGAPKFFVKPPTQRPQSAPVSRAARAARPRTISNRTRARARPRTGNGGSAAGASSVARLSGGVPRRTPWVPDQADERYWKHYTDELYLDSVKQNPYIAQRQQQRRQQRWQQQQQRRQQQRRQQQRRPQSARCGSQRMGHPALQPRRRCNVRPHSAGVRIEPTHRAGGAGARDCDALRIPFAVVGADVPADAHITTRRRGRRPSGRTGSGTVAAGAQAGAVRRSGQRNQRQHGGANAELALHEKNSKRLLDDARAQSDELLRLRRIAGKRDRAPPKRPRGRATQKHRPVLLNDGRLLHQAGLRVGPAPASTPTPGQEPERGPERERVPVPEEAPSKADDKNAQRKARLGSWASGTVGGAAASAALAAVRWRKYAADARAKNARVWWTRFERARCGRAPGYDRQYSQAQLIQTR